MGFFCFRWSVLCKLPLLFTYLFKRLQEFISGTIVYLKSRGALDDPRYLYLTAIRQSVSSSTWLASSRLSAPPVIMILFTTMWSAKREILVSLERVLLLCSWLVRRGLRSSFYPRILLYSFSRQCIVNIIFDWSVSIIYLIFSTYTKIRCCMIIYRYLVLTDLSRLHIRLPINLPIQITYSVR